MAPVSTASYRKYSARTFVRGGMSCPHCQSSLEEASDACPRCGFDYGYCLEAFPFGAPPLSLLIDPSQLLPEGLGGQVEGSYLRCRKQFPQIDFSFCFLKLQAEVELREFAFWLHNSAPAADERRGWLILVVGDLASGRIILSPGYALEPFLREEPWEAVLQEFAACIAEDSWKEGLNGFFKDASDLLGQAWELATDRLQQAASNVAEEDES